jgi:hypothetical protein
MSGDGFSSAKLDKHLAELRERQAHFRAAHPELGPMELRRFYWEQERRGPRISRRRPETRAERQRREISDFIRLVKWNMKHNPEFWE